MIELGTDNQKQPDPGDQQLQSPVVQDQPEVNGDEEQQGPIHPLDHPNSGREKTTSTNSKVKKMGPLAL